MHDAYLVNAYAQISSAQYYRCTTAEAHRRRQTLTVDIRHDQHLRLREALLQVEEVYRRVERHEAYLCATVAGKTVQFVEKRLAEQPQVTCSNNTRKCCVQAAKSLKTTGHKKVSLQKI